MILARKLAIEWTRRDCTRIQVQDSPRLRDAICTTSSVAGAKPACMFVASVPANLSLLHAIVLCRTHTLTHLPGREDRPANTSTDDATATRTTSTSITKDVSSYVSYTVLRPSSSL